VRIIYAGGSEARSTGTYDGMQCLLERELAIGMYSTNEKQAISLECQQAQHMRIMLELEVLVQVPYAVRSRAPAGDLISNSHLHNGAVKARPHAATMS